jgi:hypothetical protein
VPFTRFAGSPGACARGGEAGGTRRLGAALARSGASALKCAQTSRYSDLPERSPKDRSGGGPGTTLNILRSIGRAESVTFAAIFLWLMAVGPKQLFRDPGTLWHISVGDYMLRTGEVIRTDPFSAGFFGQPWVPVGWLSECIFALVHRVHGLDSILLFAATVLAAFYAGLARRLSARGLQGPIVALVLALSIAASSHHFHPRPHLASFVLMAWMFARLADFDAGRIPWQRLFWIAPAVALWTNLHGGVVGGLATFALCGAGWTLAALVRMPSPIRDVATFGRVALVGLVCLASVLVNPYGIELPTLWFTLLDSPVLPQLMVEHAPLSLDDGPGKLTVALALVYGAMLVGVPFRKWRVTWLMPIVWFALACSRIRNGPLFAITATIAMGEMYANVGWIRWLTAHGSDLLRLRSRDEMQDYEETRVGAFVLPAFLVAVTFVLQIASAPVPVLGHGWAKLDPSYWPIELLPELEAFERSHPEGAPVFNEMLTGGFLMYQTPKLRAFIDDRCELQGDERLSAYRRAINGETELFDEWAEQYGFEIALSNKDSVFDGYLRQSPDWELVKEAAPGALFRRR